MAVSLSAPTPTTVVTRPPLRPDGQGRQTGRLGRAVPGRSVPSAPSPELKPRGRSIRTPLGAVSAGLAGSPSHSTIRDGPARVRRRNRYKKAHSQAAPPSPPRSPVHPQPRSTNLPPTKPPRSPPPP